VGVRVQLEPCGSPAFAETSFQLLGGWESANRVEAGGQPALFSIPGASIPLTGAGLFISVSITGNAADLSVHAHLSACFNEVCDGSVPIVGSVLTGLGFPLPLLEFDDLSFTQCPAPADDNTLMIAAGGACAAILVAIVVYVFCCRTSSKTPTTGDGGSGTQLAPVPAAGVTV